MQALYETRISLKESHLKTRLSSLMHIYNVKKNQRLSARTGFHCTYISCSLHDKMCLWKSLLTALIILNDGVSGDQNLLHPIKETASVYNPQ